MNTIHRSKTITVEIEVEVYYEAVKTMEYDLDDRGIASIENVPVTCEVQTRVPLAVEEWAKTAALDLFERDYR